MKLNPDAPAMMLALYMTPHAMWRPARLHLLLHTPTFLAHAECHTLPPAIPTCSSSLHSPPPVLTTPTRLTQLDFLFWYLISFFRWLGGGGVILNPLKKFTHPINFLKILTPLVSHERSSVVSTNHTGLFSCCRQLFGGTFQWEFQHSGCWVIDKDAEC